MSNNNNQSVTTKYKLSLYNHFVEKKDTVIGLNIYKGLLFCIDKSRYQILENYKLNLEELKEKDPVFFSTMYKLGVIEDLETNLSEVLLMKNRRAVFSKESFRLIILPTLNCNFRCWYCYETREKRIMDVDVVDAIIELIRKQIVEVRISQLRIDWFGGEPLLGYESIIKPISIAIKKMCTENNVSLSVGMTTNGFFINKEMIPFFDEHMINGFQITLDGNKEAHDKVRTNKHLKVSSFDTIVNNIVLLASNIKDAFITLRINYTNESLDNCIDIINYFPNNLRSRIKVLLVHVWQDRDKYNKINNRKEILDRENKVYDKFISSGFYSQKIRFTKLNYSCYADLDSSAVVNYDGRVFKCTTSDFANAKEEGILTEEGIILWNESAISRRIARATFDRNICLQCKYLPLCSGGCSKNPIKIVEEKCVFSMPIEDNISEIIDFFHKKKYGLGTVEKIAELMHQKKSIFRS